MPRPAWAGGHCLLPDARPYLVNRNTPACAAFVEDDGRAAPENKETP